VPLRIERRGLRTKVIVWAFVPMAIVLNVVTLFAFYTYRRVTEDLVVERNRELTRLLAGQLSTRLIDYVELLSDLPSMAEAQGASQATWQGVLDANAGQLHAFDGGIVVLDDVENVVAASGGLSSAVGENGSGYLVLDQPETSQGTSHFSDTVERGPVGESVVAVVVPVNGNGERSAGSIVGLFRIRVGDEARNSLFYTALSRKLRDWRGGDVYLVDGTGRAIYHSDLSRIGESMAAQDGVRQVLAGAIRAFRTRDLAGEPIVIGIAPVPGTAWGLVTEEPWAGLIETSQGYRRLLFVFLTAGLIVPVFLIVLGVRQITRPIVELTSAAQEMAEGDFEQRIVARTGDELEDLAEQFNRMTTQLKELYASLEQRVADRTRELSALYQIATVARASLDLEEILGHSLDQVLVVMECEMGAVHLFDEQRSARRGDHPGRGGAVGPRTGQLGVRAGRAGHRAPDRSQRTEAPGLSCRRRSGLRWRPHADQGTDIGRAEHHCLSRTVLHSRRAHAAGGHRRSGSGHDRERSPARGSPAGGRPPGTRAAGA
jgi:HAMP domain-containing protein